MADMKGRRVLDVEKGLILGDYCKLPDGKWLMCLPNGLRATINNTWQITEHGDGTITVSPSILTKGHTGLSWHGFLENGIFREC